MFSIKANNINKTFLKNKTLIKALNNFNVNIPKGSIFGLLGPNGAGKSTFINIVAGLVTKDTGEIFINDLNLDKNIKICRKKIGIVPQELNIDPFFTPYELLELQAGLYGVQKKFRNTINILKKLGLENQKDAYARTLSGGMRRRLLIAKSLVHNPDIIILDEPTAGVDVELRQNLWNYIKELNQDGKTICITTHYLEEAEKLCSHILIMNKGKIVINKKKSEIMKLLTNKKVTFILNKPINKLPEEFNNFQPHYKNNFLILEYNKNTIKLKEIIDLLAKYKIDFTEINTDEGDLEKIFLDLVK
tara:strand:+ start:158 stop:1069 length:912 start_codon:yes stop_codon:yes gene_type:complete